MIIGEKPAIMAGDAMHHLATLPDIPGKLPQGYS
jgi:hypothetical protein